MILVLANHICNMGFGMALKVSSSMQFLVMFRMPLFFFVSGFLAYKASQVWNLGTLGASLLKKIRVQTIPTIVFFLFAAAVLESGIDEEDEVEDKNCAFVSEDGVRCRNHARPGSIYCGIHAGLDE